MKWKTLVGWHMHEFDQNVLLTLIQLLIPPLWLSFCHSLFHVCWLQGGRGAQGLALMLRGFNTEDGCCQKQAEDTTWMKLRPGSQIFLQFLSIPGESHRKGEELEGTKIGTLFFRSEKGNKGRGVLQEELCTMLKALLLFCQYQWRDAMEHLFA